MNHALHNRPYASFAARTAHLLLLAGLCTLLTLGTEAQARDRHTSVTTGNGQTASRDVAREKGQVSSSTVWFDGKTSSRTVDRSATGASATLTGKNGNTVNRDTTRTSTGSTTTVTGSNGQTGTIVVTH